MADKVGEKLRISVAVPVWSLVTLLCGGGLTVAYYGGAFVTQMEKLVELAKESKTVQASQQAMLDRINERQIGGLAAIANHDAAIRSLDGRVTELERRK